MALLLSVIGGVAVAARQALRRAPALAAGPIAGAVAYLAHSPLDWDWEMPAVTLTALLLAGLLLALGDGEPEPEPYRASATRGASREKIQTASAQTPT